MGSTGKNKKLNKYILLEKEKKYEIFTLLPLWYAAALRSITLGKTHPKLILSFMPGAGAHGVENDTRIQKKEKKKRTTLLGPALDILPRVLTVVRWVLEILKGYYKKT